MEAIYSSSEAANSGTAHTVQRLLVILRLRSFTHAAGGMCWENDARRSARHRKTLMLHEISQAIKFTDAEIQQQVPGPGRGKNEKLLPNR